MRALLLADFGMSVVMKERPAQDLSQVVALAGTSACPPMSQLHGEGFTCGDWLTMPHRTVVPCSGKSSCERSCFDTEWCSNWFINRAGTLCALAGPGRCKPSVDSDWTFYGVARDCSLTKAPITSRTRTTTWTTTSTSTFTTTSSTLTSTTRTLTSTSTTSTSKTSTSTVTSTTRTSTSTVTSIVTSMTSTLTSTMRASTTTSTTSVSTTSVSTTSVSTTTATVLAEVSVSEIATTTTVMEGSTVPVVVAATAVPATTPSSTIPVVTTTTMTTATMTSTTSTTTIPTTPIGTTGWCGVKVDGKLLAVFYNGAEVTAKVRLSEGASPVKDLHHVEVDLASGAYLVVTVQGSGEQAHGRLWADCDGAPARHMRRSWESYCTAGPLDADHQRGWGSGWAPATFEWVSSWSGGGLGGAQVCAFRAMLAQVGDWDPEQCTDWGDDCNATSHSDRESCAKGYAAVPLAERGRFTCRRDSWLKAETAGKTRRGSFLVLGDWGWDESGHYNLYSRACQQEIAKKMHEKFEELGDVKFVVNVGDSFYPDGVVSKADPQWQTKWRDVYSEKVRSVPWYSVYGNHDYHNDLCACGDSSHCAQVHKDGDDRDFFYMPAPSYFASHPDLNLEVVGLDTNKYQSPEGPTCCAFTRCRAECQHNLDRRGAEGMDLFWRRMEESPARIMVVFSHYPTDYFEAEPGFLAGLRDNSRHRIAYFGGHRHNTDNTSTISTFPNENWVVGGGGGFSCEPGPQQQGFVVGEIGFNDEVSLHSVLVDNKFCCRGHAGPW